MRADDTSRTPSDAITPLSSVMTRMIMNRSRGRAGTRVVLRAGQIGAQCVRSVANGLKGMHSMRTQELRYALPTTTTQLFTPASQMEAAHGAPLRGRHPTP